MKSFVRDNDRSDRQGRESGDRQELFTVGEVARLVGVSSSTLRSWEQAGLINPVRTPSGHRRYSVADLTQLREIHQLRVKHGMTLKMLQRNVAREHRDFSDSSANQEVSPSFARWSQRLRRLREEQGMTLRGAGKVTGLSASFISSIERGFARPSIASLQKLTSAYDTTIPELFGNPTAGERVLIRSSERQPYPVAEGVLIEQLYEGSRQMETHLFTIDPGRGSGGAYQHDGEEFIFVLSGKLEVWLDEFEHYLLSAGDTLYFSSTRLHQWHNSGSMPVVFLGVNTPPTF